MLGVHEGGGAAVTLRRGDDGQGERGLSRGLGSENFDDAAARNAPDAQRDIQAQRARGYRVHLIGGSGIAQAHHRALAELFLDLAQRSRERFLPIFFHGESLTRCVPIISYPTPSAHLKWVEIAENFCLADHSSSSAQVSTTV